MLRGGAATTLGIMVRTCIALLSPIGLLLMGVAGALALCPTPAFAAPPGGGECRSAAPPQIKVELQLAPLQTDLTRSVAQLGSVPGRAPGPAGASQGHILGLTQARYGEQSQLSATFQPMGDGTFCASPRSVAVTFGIQQHVVLIARELPLDSCIHREVMAHEMRHVAVDQALVKEFSPIVRRRLEEALGRIGPVRARSQEQALGTIRRPIEAALKATLQEFGRERDRRQAQVDTREEYERVSRSCNGEVSRFVPLRPGQQRPAAAAPGGSVSGAASGVFHGRP